MHVLCMYLKLRLMGLLRFRKKANSANINNITSYHPNVISSGSGVKCHFVPTPMFFVLY
jgi:hypothetical protein